MWHCEHHHEPHAGAAAEHARRWLARGKQARRWLARGKQLAAALALGCMTLQPVAAQDALAKPRSSGLSPSYVWFSASAALIAASLGGVFALRVGAIYEQAQALPPVSPTLRSLRRDAERAELSADGLFAGAAVLGVASVLLALTTDWSHAAPPQTIEWARRSPSHWQLAPTASRDGAGVLLRGALP
jgi:hypothetical protein